MANAAPSYVQIHPSYMMPEIIIQNQQPSGAFDILADEEPLVRLSDSDLAVYMNRLDIRTQVAGGQSAYNLLPSVSLEMQQISTPTYLLAVRADYDHHDTASWAQRNVSLVEAQRLGMRQAMFQQMRNALLYGMNPANGEGIMNTSGTTSMSLPADSNGHTTITTYDNGQLGTFILTQLAAIKGRCMQMGIPVRVAILTTQRVLEAIQYAGIVQLTQFQRAGGGVESIAGMVSSVAQDWNHDVVTWSADDTLIGQGAGGTDVIIITVPEIKRPSGGRINTNEFARLSTGFSGCNVMLTDMAAPREIPTPIPGGAIDILMEQRITSGWGVRPEATTIISAAYQ